MLFYLKNNGLKKQDSRNKKKFFFYIVLTITFSVFIKTFLFEIYTVQGDSMKNTLLPGDIVIVSKISYSSVSPILKDGFMVQIHKLSFSTTKNEYLKADSKICRGDIVVCDYLDHELLIKRCVGIAGDTLELLNNKVFINKQNQTFSDKVILGTSKVIRKDNSFLFESVDNWKISNFGPMYIPKKGDIIQLNYKNWILYRSIISRIEDSYIDFISGEFFLNNRKIDQYKFKYNYYFLLGDNRPESADSRTFGLVTDKDIVGKVIVY
jgi:signal peptidase I